MSEYGREALEQRAYEQAFYPGTQTLVNKFDIRDWQILNSLERRIVFEKLFEGLPPAALQMKPSAIKAIHHYLFSDLYAWAGEYRLYTTGRGAAPFARPEFIAPEIERLFARLHDEQYLKSTEPEIFAAKAAEYVNDLNAIHPFIDGNGRMQRVWLRQLAALAGYDIAFQRGDEMAWNEASKLGFYGKNEPMAELIKARLRRQKK